jgi:hypothetical protein
MCGEDFGFCTQWPKYSYTIGMQCGFPPIGSCSLAYLASFYLSVFDVATPLNFSMMALFQG